MWQPSERYPDPAVRVLDPAFSKYRLTLASVERLFTGFDDQLLIYPHLQERWRQVGLIPYPHQEATVKRVIGELRGRAILPVLGQGKARHLPEIEQPLGGPTDLGAPLTAVTRDHARGLDDREHPGDGRLHQIGRPPSAARPPDARWSRTPPSTSRGPAGGKASWC